MFDQKSYHDKWYDEHRAEQNEKRRARYRSNKEQRDKQVARASAWQRDNRERVNSNSRARRARGIRPKLTADQIRHAIERTREWRRRNKATLLAYSASRTALIAETREGRIRRKALWEQCGGICGICGQPIDRSIEYPDNMSLSYDHIIPLSKGGKHIQDNIQCCHRICNIRKRDHVL